VTALSSRRVPMMLSFIIGVALSSAAQAEEKPVNAAGYRTITLAEAGLSVMAPHPPSATETSPGCARSVRRGGKTMSADSRRPDAQCRAAKPSTSAPAN
jgi:hypothetical protein